MKIIKTTLILTIVLFFVACGNQADDEKVKSKVKKTNDNTKEISMPKLPNAKRVPAI